MREAAALAGDAITGSLSSGTPAVGAQWRPQVTPTHEDDQPLSLVTSSNPENPARFWFQLPGHTPFS